jgi:hypothetical protein
MTTGFFSWRWAPAIALVGGAIVIASLSVWLIPKSIGASPVTRAAPSLGTRTVAGNREHNEPNEAAREVMPDDPPMIRIRHTPEPIRTGVESFFPSAPEAELPPPLPDDPVPPEPPARAVDPVGPGVEPQDAPSQ